MCVFWFMHVMADEFAFLSAYRKVPCVLKDAFNASFQIINYIRTKDGITDIVKVMS